MKAAVSATQFSLWRSNELFNIDFASYSLSHHHFSRHFHDHYVIELVINGADDFYCNGKNYVAESNQLVLINPGEVHTGSTVSDTPLYYYSLYPDMKALEQVAASLDIALPADFCFQRSLLDPSLLAKKFKVFFDSLSSGEDSLHQQEIFLDCMYELLLPANYANAANYPASSTCQKDYRIQLVIDYIRLNFKKDISLQQLAGIACLNPFHLIRLFKKSVGVSPYDYLLITRAEHAKQLLRKGSLVQDAAIESGFYDSSHFNRVFSKITGTTPRAFRLSKNQYRTSFIG
jgi:AraC-like DNA-binding protein/mannose-6-phosphate isomerase-like protein (cupin superfamily)